MRPAHHIRSPPSSLSPSIGAPTRPGRSCTTVAPGRFRCGPMRSAPRCESPTHARMVSAKLYPSRGRLDQAISYPQVSQRTVTPVSRIELRMKWEERIREFQASGQSVSSWGAAQQVSVKCLRYWLRRFCRSHLCEFLAPSPSAALPVVTKWGSSDVPLIVSG